MTRLRILLAVHTFADWGGLQDWTVGMVKGLAYNGADVVLVSNNEKIISDSAESASESFLVNWSSWRDYVEPIIDGSTFDVVFSQPFASRELALELRRRTGVPIVYMAHGNNSDYAYIWRDDVAKFLVASSSLVPMLKEFCGVAEQPVEVLPNGVPSSLFEAGTVPYDERIARGTFDFVLAARLMPDKLSQVDGIIAVAGHLLRQGIIPRATIHLMGGGASKAEFASRLEAFAREAENVEFKFHGWVDQATVLHHLRTAIFAVAGGVTGAQAMALGTPCLGAGIRGICGVSTPANMDRVLGSNFGDHSARLNMTADEITRDAEWILQKENFEDFQRVYVELMRKERTHEAIAELALHQIGSAI